MNDDGVDRRWMTYDDAAAALKISGASVRRRAARARWPRQPGNDGRARVGVPQAALDAVRADAGDVVNHDAGRDAGDAAGPDIRRDVGSGQSATIKALEGHVTDLRAERDRLLARIETLEAERRVIRRRGRFRRWWRGGR